MGGVSSGEDNGRRQEQTRTYPPSFMFMALGGLGGRGVRWTPSIYAHPTYAFGSMSAVR